VFRPLAVAERVHLYVRPMPKFVDPIRVDARGRRKVVGRGKSQV
jgi:hypothetical protein